MNASAATISASTPPAPRARGIAAAEFADRRADEQRERRRDGDDGLLGAAEQPEHQAGEQAGVEARLGRQPGERRVADAGRQQIGGEREAGDEIRPQPGRVVSGSQSNARAGPRRPSARLYSTPAVTSQANRRASERRPGHDVRRRLTFSCASERASDALTDATSSSEIFSRSRAAARARASSAFASSMLSAESPCR